MPKGSYKDIKSARKNVKLIMNKTKCDAIKLESNGKNFHIIQNLVKNKIAVMGHIGYTPQFKKKFKIEGVSKLSVLRLLKEAKSIEKAGAFSIVLECISSTSKINYRRVKYPHNWYWIFIELVDKY